MNFTVISIIVKALWNNPEERQKETGINEDVLRLSRTPIQ